MAEPQPSFIPEGVNWHPATDAEIQAILTEVLGSATEIQQVPQTR